MGKIGRNDPCPCGSGKKYKNCCLRAQQEGAAAKPAPSVDALKGTLLTAIENMQTQAAAKKPQFQELGVFLLYCDAAGDAWLLEVTESDAVQIARAGEPLAPPIDEDSKTIAINFSHTFAVHNRQLVLTAYADKSESVLELAPTQQIHAAIRRLLKRIPPELRASMHVNPEDEAPAA